jgi:hypothetical protein
MTLGAMSTPDQRQPTGTSSGDHWFWPLLGAILLLALAVRHYGLGREDYWLDELHSMANSAGKRAELEATPYGEILLPTGRPTDLDENSTAGAVWRTMQHDTHPPVYFILLLYWRQWFGDGEAAVRLLPVLFSVLSIVPLALAVRILGGAGAALTAALLCSLSSTHTWMAQENRPYSLSILLTTLGFFWLIKIGTGWRDRKPWFNGAHCAFYGLTVYLALLTHYFSGLVILAQVLYALLSFRGPVLRAWFVSILLAGVGAAGTWGGVLVDQLPLIRNQPWLLELHPQHSWRTVLRLADLPLRLLIPCPRFQIGAERSILGLAMLAVCSLPFVHRRSRTSLPFLLWYGVPALALAKLDLVTDRQLLTHLRYSSIAVPGAAALFAMALFTVRPSLRGTVLVLILLTVSLRLDLPAAANPHARLAARRLEETVSPGDLVIYDAVGWPRDWVPQFYVPISYYRQTAPGPSLLLRDPAPPGLRNEIQKFPGIVVVSPRVRDDDPQVAEVPYPAPDTHERVSTSRYINQIGWVYRFQRKG